jgi:hypothetical protein
MEGSCVMPAKGWKKYTPEEAALRKREGHRIAQKKWRDRNRERVRENMRNWNAANRDKANGYRRKQYYRQQYGLTCEQRDAHLTNAVCAGCGGTDRLVIDHCHTRGGFRGVLCDNCNKSLGLLRDSPSTLRTLAEYLERYNGRH